MASEIINALDSESGIIASLIHKPELSFYSEQLLPLHFTQKDNRCVYVALCKLAANGITRADPYNIIEVLNSDESTRKYADELSIDKLQELVDMSDVLARSSPEEYKILVSNVLDAAFRRDMYQRLNDCQKLCLDRKEVNIEHRIYDLVDEVMSSYSYTEEVPEFRDVVDELWSDVKAHQNGAICGIPFKFPTLNEFTTLEPSELVVVAAKAKGAKSMLMLNEAVDVMKMGKSVLYIDSELSSRLFLIRLVSHLTQIEFSRVKNGRYNEDEEKEIDEAIDWIKEQRFVHIYMPIFSIDNIYTAVKSVMHRFDGLDLLIVDYIKSTNTDGAWESYAELGKLTDFIKNDVAGKLGIAALAAAQLTEANKLADSAKIVRNASTIMMMLDKTPEEIEADGEECGNKKLIVTQNRNGMQHAPGEYISLLFDGNRVTLTEAKQAAPRLPY